MVEQDLLYAYQGSKATTKGEESVEDHLPTSFTQGASNLHSDEDMEDKIKLLDQRVQKLIRTYLEVFGELSPPASCDKLVQMDLKLKPEFVGHKIRRRPYPAPKGQADEIEQQIQKCIDAGLVLEYKDRDHPQHCSPCFLVAKPAPMILAAVFSQNSKSQQKADFRGKRPTFVVSTAPKKGGGFLLPGFCPKISKTLKFGLFWGIFACSGLVLQNSAAHQCTCL